MAAETTSEAANANQRPPPLANTFLPTNSTLVSWATRVAIFVISGSHEYPAMYLPGGSNGSIAIRHAPPSKGSAWKMPVRQRVQAVDGWLGIAACTKQWDYGLPAYMTGGAGSSQVTELSVLPLYCGQ